MQDDTLTSVIFKGWKGYYTLKVEPKENYQNKSSSVLLNLFPRIIELKGAN